MSAQNGEETPYSDLRELNIADILPNERNPRLIFPQEELDLLAESIDQRGILVPIVVYSKDDQFVLIDGERRFRCAQILQLPKVPALVTSEKSNYDLLEEMFNIHLIREPWQDMPTAKALQELAIQIQEKVGTEPTDRELKEKTGLSLERVRRLRYVITLPAEWQQYIQEGRVPLNFFWELKKSVIDPLASMRPDILKSHDADVIMQSFVAKRLSGVITDTVSLRDVTPIIRYSAQAAREGGPTSESLDQSIHDLIMNPDTTIDEVFQDTVQIMVEADKLERRSASMVAAFSRLMFTSPTEEDRTKVRAIARQLISQLEGLIGNDQIADPQD